VRPRVRSEWKQSTGECISGPLEGATLSVLPAGTTTWGAFRNAAPEGIVVCPPGGKSEASGPEADPRSIECDADPYGAYFETDGFDLDAHRGGDGRDWDRDDLDPKAVVVGLEAGGEALGAPPADVKAAGSVLSLIVGGRGVVLFASGEGLHAFEDPGYDFEHAENGFRADGAVWSPATGESTDGRHLDRVPVRRLFAFAWQDDHGPDSFYSPGD